MVGLLICTLPLRVKKIAQSASCIGRDGGVPVFFFYFSLLLVHDIVIVVWVAFTALESQVQDWPILPFFSHAVAVLHPLS